MTRQARALLVALVVTVSFLGVAAAPAAASHDGGDCSFPLTQTDNTDTEVTIEEEPAEVVVLDAASAQTLWEIGAEDRVTGMPVRDYTAYLEGSEERTDVLTDDGTGVDTEAVVELEPDVVLAPNYTPPETIEQLRDADLTVYQVAFEESFEDVYAKTEFYGHVTGECESAGQVADDTRTSVEAVRETVADRDRPRVLYYFYGFTAGEGTFIGDMVVTAGGENVAATAGIQGFQEISDETIVEQDPEWIVTVDEEGAIDTEREALASTTAVENDQVLRLDPNLVSQAGPRVVEPLQLMAETFHSEAFQEETDTATATETGTDEGGTDGVGAGFGAAAAVACLVAAGLLARRA